MSFGASVRQQAFKALGTWDDGVVGSLVPVRQYAIPRLVVGLLSLSANLIETVSATRGRSQPGLKHCPARLIGGVMPKQ